MRGNLKQQQMTEALNDDNHEDNIDPVNPEISPLNTQENFPDLKRGIKQPKSPLQWSTANDFLKLTFLNHPITPDDLNNNINTMVTVVYNYFSGNFGHIDNNSSVEFERKYQTFSTNDLKKALKKLKLENGSILEIKFVAKKLRVLLNKSNNTELHNSDSHASADIDQDNLIGKNFWGYVKKFFKKNTSSLPSLNLAQCTSYFPKTFSAISQVKHSIFLVGR
jgi:hypothetical protein